MISQQTEDSILVEFTISSLLCLAILYTAFKYYTGKYDLSTWDIDPKRTTPSHRKSDQFFFPVSRWMLFGSHLQSVVTVGTIFLPSICLTFGWVPALLLLLVGTCFSGWIHDYVSIILSVRNEGETLSSLFEELLGRRSGSAFWLLGVFCAVVLSSLSVLQCTIILEMYPAGFISTISILLSGVVFTVLFYRKRSSLFIAIAASLGFVLLGVELGLLVPLKGLDRIVIMSILYSAALLYVSIPSRYLLQSARFVASIPTFIVIVYVLVISLAYSFVSPPPTSAFVVLSLSPFTLLDSFWSAFLLSSACGIISGWHGLVGSSVTSRHLDLETDVHVISAGSMFVESALALGSLVVYASMGSETISSVGGTPWEVFLLGLSRQIEYIGGGNLTLFLQSLTVTILAFCCINSLQLVISFWKSDRNVSRQKHGQRQLGKFFFISACLAMSCFLTLSSSLMDLWFLFAGVNQLLAGLTLLLATLYLKRAGKEILQTIVPSVFFTLSSLAFLFYLGIWRFFGALDLDDLLEASTFSQSFSGAVNLLFLVALSLFSVAIGLWLAFKTFYVLSLGKKWVERASVTINPSQV